MPAPEQAKDSVDWWARAFALIAALVAAGGFAYNVWHDRSTRGEQHQGAARLMQQEFLTRYCDVQSTLRRGRYPKATISLATVVPADDRLKVAAGMRRADWQKVAIGYGHVRRAERALARPSKETNDGHVTLSAGDETALNRFGSEFSLAFVALDSAADSFGGRTAESICGRLPS